MSLEAAVSEQQQQLFSVSSAAATGEWLVKLLYVVTSHVYICSMKIADWTNTCLCRWDGCCDAGTFCCDERDKCCQDGTYCCELGCCLADGTLVHDGRDGATAQEPKIPPAQDTVLT